MRFSTGSDNTLRRGRLWLYLTQSYRRAINLEWVFFKRSFGFNINLFGGDGDDDLQFYLACGLFSVWLTFEGILPRRWRPDWKPRMDCERQIGVRYFGQLIWIDLWHAPMGCSSRDDPWWWQITLHPVDWLLGKRQYSEKPIVSTNTKLRMCEHEEYPATVQLFESTWKRPRWFAQKIQRARVEVEGGVPHPGKGTTSYNCEDDATFSLTTPAASVRGVISG